jgi:NAD(P)-dependent dehydrogenase (short-subunit alcohol dehydrogenase family)
MKDPLFDLTGKVAIVTGGHSWLGYDMATVLAEHGCHIVIASRSAEKNQATCKKISSLYPVDCTYIKFDLTDSGDCVRMADEAQSWKGHIDILINNSGGGSGASEGDFLLRDPQAVVSLITTNLVGTLFCTQAVGRHMVKRQAGKIISIASIAGLVGRDRSMYRRNGKMEQPVDYAASKAGIIGMTRDLAAYFAPYNIQANAISPGGFDKGDLPQGFVDDYSRATMAGRMGIMGKDIKGAALFLASPCSDYMTGHNLVIDGGFSVYK